MGLRKAKAKEKPTRTWDSAQCKSKDKTLRVMHMQVVALAVCKFVTLRL
jgi:hypothetical protein